MLGTEFGGAAALLDEACDLVALGVNGDTTTLQELCQWTSSGCSDQGRLSSA